MFFYLLDQLENFDFYVSAGESGLPATMLELTHSFGYDCRRRGNLVILDTRTLAYVAGNLVQIVDIETKEQKYIRSTGGVAIGAICVSRISMDLQLIDFEISTIQINLFLENKTHPLISRNMNLSMFL